MGYVYCLRAGFADRFKVGMTRVDPESRRRALSQGSPEKLTLHRTIECADARSLEQYVHWLLDPWRTPNGEFFDVSAAALDEAIATAEAFFAKCRPAVEAARRFAGVKPSGRLKTPTTTAAALHEQLRAAERERYLLEQRILLLQSRLQMEIGESLGIDGVASWRWQEQWRLDIRSLKEKEPAVYERHRRLFCHRVFVLERGRLGRATKW